MTAEMLERVAARAASMRSERADQWRELQAKAPELAAFAADLAKHTGKLHAITFNGIRYGDAPIERNVPPIPGVRR